MGVTLEKALGTRMMMKQKNKKKPPKNQHDQLEINLSYIGIK